MDTSFGMTFTQTNKMMTVLSDKPIPVFPIWNIELVDTPTVVEYKWDFIFGNQYDVFSTIIYE